MITIMLLLFLMISEATAITGADMVAPFYRIACLIYDVGLNTMGALASLMLVYGGIKWIVSEDPESRLQARHIATYSIAGVILFVLIKMILKVILPELADVFPEGDICP